MIIHPQENRFRTDTYRMSMSKRKRPCAKQSLKPHRLCNKGGGTQPGGLASLCSLIRCDTLKVELHQFRAQLTSNGLISRLARTAADLYWQTLGRLDYKFEARLKWRLKEICLISAPPAPTDERSPVPRPLRPVSSDRSPGGNTSL